MAILSFDIGIRNLAYCILDEQQHIQDWKVLSLSHRKRIQYDILCESVVQTLNQIDLTQFNIQQVVLERQMTAKMRVVCAMIQTYYVVKGIPTVLFSPVHKLQSLPINEQDAQLVPIRAKKNTYGYRKNLSKQFCKILLERNHEKNEMIDLYMKSTKKDDLSDSYLQGLAFQSKKNILNNQITVSIEH